MVAIGPVVAGSFYPGNPHVLGTQVGALLAAAEPDPVDNLSALIVPHAGYIYSGPVAATAYSLLDGRSFDRVVLIGPSHFVRFEGLARPAAETWRIPLGEFPIEQEASIPSLAEPFATEHCLDVQLPFLYETLGPLPIMPVLTGDNAPDRAAETLEGIVDDRTLLVVSTDLSHYLPYETAQRVDTETAAFVTAVKPERLARESACGRTGLQAALLLTRLRRWRVHLLDLRNSGDTAGDRSRVVGYGAFAIGR